MEKMMLFGRSEWSNAFLHAADAWENNKAILGEIDSQFGDGDHGLTMVKIAKAVRQSVQDWTDQPLQEFLSDLSFSIMGVGGGAAGPLYGTVVGGMAEPLLADAQNTDAQMLKAMLVASQEAMEATSKARAGDKTMMDALIPAVAAAQEADDDIAAVLQAAADAAAGGAEATANMVAKYGRARNYGEATIGTRDAGAVSLSLFFKGLAER